MRSVIAIVGAFSLVVAQVSPGFAQSTLPVPVQPAALSPPAETAVNPTIVEAFKAYPKGGDQLSKRISDFVVKDPKLAVGLVRYVRTAPGLVKDQKVAAERGLADALTRMGVKAADMPVKAPVQEVWDPTYLLALLALAGVVASCFAWWCNTTNNQPPPVVSHH
jgi:hypothetical protein